MDKTKFPERGLIFIVNNAFIRFLKSDSKFSFKDIHELIFQNIS